MNTPSVAVERRIGQRFAFNLPVSLREASTSLSGLGFTHDVSSRGVFLFTEMPLREGMEIELTLMMPSEITLGESMRVRCRGRVLRILTTEEKRDDAGKNHSVDNKIGVAVCLSSYEYLPEMEDGSVEFRRIAALHHSFDAEQNRTSSPEHPRVSH
jgi:PilZ domain